MVGGQPAKVIILGAGRPFRGETPSPLNEFPDHTHVLEWLIKAFAGVEAELCFVGGYRIEEIAERYPHITYSINPHWESTGSVVSLFSAPLNSKQTHYICYADVVCSPNVVASLDGCSGDLIVAVDTKWRQRYEGRSEIDIRRAETLNLSSDIVKEAKIEDGLGDAEFAGVVKISPHAMDEILLLKREPMENLRNASIPDLFQKLIDRGLSLRAVDVSGKWAELNEPQDLAEFVFGTKAKTLERLRPLVRKSKISEQVTFTLADWNAEQDRILSRIGRFFDGKEVSVRSSSIVEDQWNSSKAGIFHSELNVSANMRDRLTDAIEKVIRSYGDGNPDHQVLVQEMVKDVTVSGVAFTRTIENGAPYYIITYDDSSASTETATSGSSPDLKVLVLHRSSKSLPPKTPPALTTLLPALRECERLIGHDALDAEFAVNRKGELFLLQVRPLSIDYSSWKVPESDINTLVFSTKEYVKRKQSPASVLLGPKTIFGVMPDWNPAEIIGRRPRLLALSLYQHLVTDEVWAIQRSQFGYRDVRPCPLIVCLGGQPYIDTRVCFNSFVPAVVPEHLAEKLVAHYLNRLEEHPEFHDKVEFEIVFNCLTFDFDSQARRLIDAGFSNDEIGILRHALRDITINALKRWPRDLDAINRLASRREQHESVGGDPLSQAAALLDDCRRFGILHFAHLARCAFIAMALLRSATESGILSSRQLDSYLSSLETVAKQFTRDRARYHGTAEGKQYLRERYGHLRPGTYDITSPKYADDPERFLWNAQGIDSSPPVETFHWNKDSRRSLGKALSDIGLPNDVDAFDRFLRGTMEGREFAKFIFTRNLSDALDLIGEFGRSMGLRAEQMADLTIGDIFSVAKGWRGTDLAVWLEKRAEEGAEWHMTVSCVELPPLATSADDVLGFVYGSDHPTFITRGRIIAPSTTLRDNCWTEEKLIGKIVVVEKADPGFDWLFGHQIAGLITAYGGANSHMAIRAAEFGVPSAIGIGELNFRRLQNALEIELDCDARRIQVVQ
ncbi:PEP/pyruvate-binding domain-containing protein [Nitrospinota bacterium]